MLIERRERERESYTDGANHIEHEANNKLLLTKALLETIYLNYFKPLSTMALLKIK